MVAVPDPFWPTTPCACPDLFPCAGRPQTEPNGARYRTGSAWVRWRVERHPDRGPVYPHRLMPEVPHP
jgi:hypothetical protein